MNRTNCEWLHCVKGCREDNRLFEQGLSLEQLIQLNLFSTTNMEVESRGNQRSLLVGRSESWFYFVHYSLTFRPEATSTARLTLTLVVKLRNMPCHATCQVLWLISSIHSSILIIYNIPDIKAEIAETINIEWVKSRKHPLLPYVILKLPHPHQSKIKLACVTFQRRGVF